MNKRINVGLVGYGFMGRAHSNAYRQVAKFFDLEYEPVLKAVCARNEKKLEAFADNWGWESCETDWRKLIERDDIDLIDICSPNNTHREIAIAAAQAGKVVACEKPLAMNADEAKVMTDTVEKAGVPNMVWFNYRRVPAVALAKSILEEGRIGRIFHYRAKYLQDWTMSPSLPQGGATLWRMDAPTSASPPTSFASTLIAAETMIAFQFGGEKCREALESAETASGVRHRLRPGCPGDGQPGGRAAMDPDKIPVPPPTCDALPEVPGTRREHQEARSC